LFTADHTEAGARIFPRRGLTKLLVFGNEAAEDGQKFGDYGAPSAQRARPALVEPIYANYTLDFCENIS
jgi:hypothetical protein